ncbi:MAG: CoA transferase [Pseudaminobacter sp.]
MSSELPLEGITVVEFGHSIAAPYAGLILADLGARVVKIENPANGDYARGWGPPFWADVATAFHCFNRGKESVAVDLSDTAQVTALRAFILEHADVVIQNLRAGVLESRGLGYDMFRNEKPELLWADIGAFGSSGPLSDKPGYDPLAQAFAGIMSVTGEKGRPPVRVGVSLVDMGSGMWTVIGLLAALLNRTRTSKGARIGTSLFETGLAWMTVHLGGFAANGEVRQPHGSGLAEIVPYQAFQCRDGWLMISAGNDNLFRKFVQALGLPELVASPEFATNPGRVENRDKLIPILEQTIAESTVAEMSALLDDCGVPCAPINSVDEVIRHPQTQSVGMIEPSAPSDLPTVGIPITIDAVRPRVRGRAPGLGEHNAVLNKPATQLAN